MKEELIIKIYSLVALTVWATIVPFFIYMQIIFFVLDPFLVRIFDFPPMTRDEFPLSIWLRGIKKIASNLFI